jgi:hypothetical protein
MTLESWIKWAFVPCQNGRHPFHSYALCRQAARDMGVPIDHDTFVAAMKAAGYRVVRRYGRAIYFDCLDTPEKRAFYRRRYIACDDRVIHPLAMA